MMIQLLITGARIAAPFARQAAIGLTTNLLLPAAIQGTLIAAVERYKLPKEERTMWRSIKVASVETGKATVWLVIHAPVEIAASVVSQGAYKMGFKSIAMVADGVFVGAISFRVLRMWRSASNGKHADLLPDVDPLAVKLTEQADWLRSTREMVQELRDLELDDDGAKSAIDDRIVTLERQIKRAERRLVKGVQTFLKEERDQELVHWPTINDQIHSVPNKVQIEPSQADLVNAQIAYVNAMRLQVDAGAVKFSDFRTVYHTLLWTIEQFKVQGGDTSKLIDLVNLPTPVQGNKPA
jgi:hypothetical protein